ncbi:MAG: ExbD/TolR family protein [Planctomycetota bacterium]|jgi:biopolymer transport protein ExbD
MADDPIRDDSLPAEDEDIGPVLPHRRVPDTSEMDITPMIDITFLLLIFFLVCSTASPETAVDLPEARYGTGIGHGDAAIITMAKGEGGGPAVVYLADGKRGDPLPSDEEEQEEAIRDYVESQGKQNVLIKAEEDCKTGDVWRVESAAALEGVGLHVAVEEIE